MKILAALEQRALAAGAKGTHIELMLRAWLGGQGLDAFARHPAFAFPSSLLPALDGLTTLLDGVARTVSTHPSADGSCRLLIELADGLRVESVLLDRGTLCVSTQVGCAVGCVFCKTGESGLLRNLEVSEVLAQVALARRMRRVIRVVFMGMGEPAHNLEAVLLAIRYLGNAGQIAHKNLVFSTVGSRAVFERLPAADVRPALALSLHTTFADKRRELLPRAPGMDPASLVAAADTYAHRIHHPVQYQWTLLRGINDGDDEVARLIPLLLGRNAILNFIPYNRVQGFAFDRPAWDHGVAMVRKLRAAGIVATVRRSGGQDVDGACGQLRARSAGILPS